MRKAALAASILAVGGGSAAADTGHFSQHKVTSHCLTRHPGATQFCTAVALRRTIAYYQQKVKDRAPVVGVSFTKLLHGHGRSFQVVVPWSVPRFQHQAIWWRTQWRRVEAMKPIDPVAAIGIPQWWLSEAYCVAGKESGHMTSMSPTSTPSSGGPFYGEYQMDLDFGQTYGPEFYRRWGPPNNWPGWAQTIAAYRGWKARGWEPWPNTSLACGLSY